MPELQVFGSISQKQRFTGQSDKSTELSVSWLNSSSEWRMSYPPLTLGPHLSYARNWRATYQLKQPQLTSLSHFSPSSLSLKEQEQERTRERKWRLEMKVEDEVKTCNPRSSPHQAQLILISWSWLPHELSSHLVGNFSQTLISNLSCMYGSWSVTTRNIHFYDE